MNRRANQRPLFCTNVPACALILLTLSGCSLFSSTSTFSNLLQSGMQTSTADDAEPDAKTDSPPGNTDRLLLTDHELPRLSDEPATPSGRLLSPEFPTAALESRDSSGGHSLGGDLDSSSPSLYPTTIRPISKTRELFDPPGSSASAESSPRSVESMEQTVDAMADAAAPPYGNPQAPIEASPVSVETRVAEAPRQPSSAAQPERSMLERLRGFAPDRRTGSLWRRQIQRIPSPWDLLPGRDDGEEPPAQDPSETTTVEVQPAPTPIDVDISSADTSELLQALIATLERELESWPQTDSGLALQPDEYRRRQLNLRLLRLIDDEPAAAAEAIDLMSPEEQEFWQELILGISRFRTPDENADYEQHIAQTIGQLRQAVQQLEPLSSLRIRRIEFCTRINNFGAIETFPSNSFEPAQRLLIYAEVENLQSDVSPPPLNSYRTSFTSKLEIWSDEADAPEQPLESWPIETVHEDSSTRRSDYFQSYEFTLPPHLPQGKYEIRLQVHDDISERTAHAQLKFVVQ